MFLGINVWMSIMMNAKMCPGRNALLFFGSSVTLAHGMSTSAEVDTDPIHQPVQLGEHKESTWEKFEAFHWGRDGI